MKFLPAFLTLGLLACLAYMVWTNQYPYHWLPEDPADPNRVQRAQETIQTAVGYFGAFRTGAGLLMAGAILSLFFLMEEREKWEP